MSGQVYAICAGDAVKVGVTTNSVESRLSELQTGNSHKLGIAAVYECRVMDAYDVEGRVHSLLSRERIRGEWFRPGVALQRILVLMRHGCLEEYLDPGIEFPEPVIPESTYTGEEDGGDPLAPIPVRVELKPGGSNFADDEERAK